MKSTTFSARAGTLRSTGVRRGARERFWPLLAFSTLAAALVVGWLLSERWNGSRTETEAHVPLRPLSTLEAGLLVSHHAAQIVDLDESTATLATTKYLLPVSPTQARREARDDHPNRVEYKAQTFDLLSGSWEGFATTHRVKRSDLEKELGRKLGATDVARSDQQAPVSFSSSLVWLYVLCEVAFLTSVLAFTLFGLSRIRNPFLVLPLLTVGVVLPFLLFVPFYSPALVDADDFFQRIAVEYPYRPFLALFPAAFWLSLWSLWCAFVFGMKTRGGGALGGSSRRRGMSPVLLQGALALLPAVALAVFLAQEYVSLRLETSEMRRELVNRSTNAFLGRLRVEARAQLAAGRLDVDLTRQGLLTPELGVMISDVFLGVRGKQGVTGELLVPVENDIVFFATADATSRYADLHRPETGRSLGTRSALDTDVPRAEEDADLRIAHTVLRTGARVVPGFLEYAKGSLSLTRAPEWIEGAPLRTTPSDSGPAGSTASAAAGEGSLDGVVLLKRDLPDTVHSWLNAPRAVPTRWIAQARHWAKAHD